MFSIRSARERESPRNARAISRSPGDPLCPFVYNFFSFGISVQFPYVMRVLSPSGVVVGSATDTRRSKRDAKPPGVFGARLLVTNSAPRMADLMPIPAARVKS